MTSPGAPLPSLLITAGPTHEPIDAVRYIANRSSGRLGIALSDEATRRGLSVRLLLGPTPLTPAHSPTTLERFRTTTDLQRLLATHLPQATILIMAAAVADYRPVADAAALVGKRRREAPGLTLTLEATPDLLAQAASTRRPGQFLVGFALEPRSDLLTSGRAKLDRKGIDMIVANPLETMDSDTIEATVMTRDGLVHSTAGAVHKRAFAPWLLDIILAAAAHADH